MEERKDSTQIASDENETQAASDADSVQVEKDSSDADVIQVQSDGKSALDPKEIDPQGKCRYWLREQLCEDPDCAMDPLDIHHALGHSLPADREQHDRIARLADPRSIAAVWNKPVTDIFPNATTRPTTLSRNGNKYSDVFGVRWRKLEGCLFSNAIPCNVRGHFMDDAHALLHLPQPARSAAWLRMYIKSDPDTSLSMHSIGSLYEYSFSRSRDTHSLLSRNDLRDVVLKTFRGTEEVQVTKDYSVIKGITTAESTAPERVLAKKSRAEYKKFSRVGLIREPPTAINKFTQQVLKDPLLPNRPLKYNPAEPGPFIERLRRRAENPRQPLGDEEPGFPGVSMKTEQRREKIVAAQWEKLVLNSLVNGPPMTRLEMSDAIVEALVKKASTSKQAENKGGQATPSDQDEGDAIAETILQLQKEVDRELRRGRKK